MRHLDAGRKTVGEDAAGAAFKHGQQAGRRVKIGIVEMQRRGQLAFEVLGNVRHFLGIAAGDQERGRTEHFLGQRRIGQEGGARRAKQRRTALAAVVRRADQRVDAGVFGNAVRGSLVARGDAA